MRRVRHDAGATTPPICMGPPFADLASNARQTLFVTDVDKFGERGEALPMGGALTRAICGGGGGERGGPPPRGGLFPPPQSGRGGCPPPKKKPFTPTSLNHPPPPPAPPP